MKQNNSSTRTRSPFTQIFGGSADSEPEPKAERSSSSKKTREPQGEASSESPRKEAGDQERAPSSNGKPARPKSAPEPPIASAQPERIDAVRELLFGDQVSELKEALHTVESRLVARITKLEEDTTSAIDKSERNLKAEMETVRHEIRAEKEKSRELSTESARKLDTAALDLGGKITSLSDELRRRLEDETGSIREDFARREDLGKFLSEMGEHFKTGPKKGK